MTRRALKISCLLLGSSAKALAGIDFAAAVDFQETAFQIDPPKVAVVTGAQWWEKENLPASLPVEMAEAVDTVNEIPAERLVTSHAQNPDIFLDKIPLFASQETDVLSAPAVAEENFYAAAEEPEMIATKENGVAKVVIVPSASKTKIKKVAAPLAGGLELILNWADENIAASRKNVDLPRLGDSLRLRWRQLPPSQKFGVFVRDRHIAVWDAEASVIKALQPGRTEIFIVAESSMVSLQLSVAKDAVKPVVKDTFSVEAPLAAVDSLALPEGIDGLSDLPVDVAGQMKHASVRQSIAPLEASEVAENAAPESEEKPKKINQKFDLNMPEELSAVSRDEKMLANYNVSEKTPTVDVELQFVDERSRGEEVFPVSGLWVRVIGSSESRQIDNQGRLVVHDLPARSRIFVEYYDATGVIRHGVTEVHVGQQKALKKIIRVRRGLAFDHLSELSSAGAQHSELSSLCGLLPLEQEEDPSSQWQVTIDVPANAPLYLNDLGLADPRQDRLSSVTSTFCFLNVAPGPALLNFYRNGAYQGSYSLALMAGRHTEEQLDLLHSVSTPSLVTEMLPSAGDELQSHGVGTKFTLAEGAVLQPLGLYDPMTEIERGVQTADYEVLASRGRYLVVAQGGDIEQSLYQVSLDAKQTRLSQRMQVLPKGFVADMAFYAQEEQDDTLGAVLVQYGGKRQDKDHLASIELVDINTFEVRKGWVYSDTPTLKAMFFNLPPGAYTLQIKDGQGHLDAADTIFVYGSTSTVVDLRETSANPSQHLAEEP